MMVNSVGFGNDPGLSRRIALLDRIWRPNPVEMDVIYGRWHFIDADYESHVIAERARLRLESAD
jgi:hypothetical protein